MERIYISYSLIILTISVVASEHVQMSASYKINQIGDSSMPQIQTVFLERKKTLYLVGQEKIGTKQQNMAGPRLTFTKGYQELVKC